MDLKILSKIQDSLQIEDAISKIAKEKVSNLVQELEKEGFTVNLSKENSISVEKLGKKAFDISVSDDKNPYFDLRVYRGVTISSERNKVRSLLEKYNKGAKKDVVSDEVIEFFLEDLKRDIKKAEDDGNNLIYSAMFKNTSITAIERKDYFEYSISIDGMDKITDIAFTSDDLLESIERDLKEAQQE